MLNQKQQLQNELSGLRQLLEMTETIKKETYSGLKRITTLSQKLKSFFLK